MPCRFCQIIRGELPAYVVYETEMTIAFLDKYPVQRGHVLVVPKKHAALLEELDDESLADLARVAARVSKALRSVLSADATTVGVNNGRAAGQAIPHVHVHVIPRYRGDGAGSIHTLDWPRPVLTREEFRKIAEDLRAFRG